MIGDSKTNYCSVTTQVSEPGHTEEDRNCFSTLRHMLIQLYSTAVSFVATTANSNLDPILKTQKRIIRNIYF